MISSMEELSKVLEMLFRRKVYIFRPYAVSGFDIRFEDKHMPDRPDICPYCKSAIVQGRACDACGASP